MSGSSGIAMKKLGSGLPFGLRKVASSTKKDVVEGLENAPRAFIGLMQGGNFGKLLVKVSEE